MAQVFISYSRRDLEFVEQLAADLQRTGFDVWYDVSKLAGGARWRSEIEQALKDSQYVLVVLSPDAIASEWVEREFLYSSNLKRKIIPLMYRSCELPLNYVNLNYIDVQGDNYSRNFQVLLWALDYKSPATTEETSIIPEAPARKVLSPGFLSIFVVVLLLGGLAIGSYLFFGRPERAGTPTDIPTPVLPTPTLSTDITDEHGAVMAYIPPGDFEMGSDTGEEDEKPAHTVSLPSYYIDKYEVTNKQYQACLDSGGCTPPHSPSSFTHPDYFKNPAFADYPVIHVNWDQAKTYCAWRGALLPSEAQWEKAARGTTGYIYPWGNEIDGSYANYDGAFRRDTSKVGSYESGKSVYGVYDMVGNVWEWVSSLYMPYPYRVDERENPNTPGDRVVRGGSWYDHTAGLRVTDRYGDPTRDENDGLGFRCVREAYP